MSNDGPMTGGSAMMMAAKSSAGALPVEGEMPSLSGATAWLNSPALTPEVAARQSRLGRFLDLFLYQLLAGVAVCEGMVRKI